MVTRIDKYKRKPMGIYHIYHWLDRFSTKSLVITSILVLMAMVSVSIDGVNGQARVALFSFLSAMIFWVGVNIPAGFVAITLIIFIILTGTGSQELLYQSLSEEVVWLMIGSFIIGEAVKQTGLAERFSRSILAFAVNKNSVLLGVTAVLFATAFFIPSTSGRAALAMPVMKQLNEKFTEREQKVLSILAPVIILMSTSATVIGAGSHIIGIGLLESTTGQSISYSQWLVWGAPFAVIVTLFSLLIIKWVLWPKEALKEWKEKPSQTVDQPNRTMNRKEKQMLILLTFLMVGWMTEHVHGYDIAFITIIGAVLVMVPNYGIMNWKQGMKAVSWNLIVFVAAATALGKVLVDTGVINWMKGHMLQVLGLVTDTPEWLIVVIVLLFTVTSHVYITSHTTRAIVWIPALLIFSETINVNPSAVVFLSLIGMNYCVTFPVSSKALLLFYEEGEVSYEAKDLLKLSVILMPLYVFTAVCFYFTYWKWTGMHL